MSEVHTTQFRRRVYFLERPLFRPIGCKPQLLLRVHVSFSDNIINKNKLNLDLINNALLTP